MSEIKLEETPTLTFEPFKEEPQLPVPLFLPVDISQSSHLYSIQRRSQ